MDIWLDTTNMRAVQRAVRLGLLSGVTTNPSLIAQSKRPLESVLKDLLHHQEGPVTVQVMSHDVSEMVQQGQSMYSLSNRLVIKVPVTKNGLEALYLLSRQGIPTMATMVFQPRQALLAALVGANYIAPYIGRLEKAGQDPWQLLKDIVHLFQNYHLKTKILAASLNSAEQFFKCAEMGIYGATVKDDLFEALLESDPLALEAEKQFAMDWKSVQTHLFD